MRVFLAAPSNVHHHAAAAGCTKYVSSDLIYKLTIDFHTLHAPRATPVRLFLFRGLNLYHKRGAMAGIAQRILVVGGNGFIGSAVCKAALARGYQVTSVSSSGRPFRTPKGHAPAWTSKVDWQMGDALRPETFAHLLSGAGAVVHTLGTLIEDGGVYKKALRDGNVLGALTSFARSAGGRSRLTASDDPGSYGQLNRESALRVAKAFLETPQEENLLPRAFVYLSAEDIFRPFIPAGYIQSKREAELSLSSMFSARPDYRTVYIRPSLVYHAHYRPFTTPIAALFDFSAAVHAKAPAGVPTPSGLFRTLGRLVPNTGGSPHVPTSALDSVANAMTLPPIHVDHVAEACCIAADRSREDVRGVYGVQEIRELIGWAGKGAAEDTASTRTL